MQAMDASTGEKNLSRALIKIFHSKNLHELTRNTCSAIKQLVMADSAVLILQKKNGIYFCREAAQAENNKWFETKNSEEEKALAEKKIMVINDIPASTEIKNGQLLHAGFQSLLLVPLNGDHQPAAIAGYWKEKYRASNESLEIFSLLAETAAEVLEQMNTRAELEKKLKESESAFQNADKDIKSLASAVSHDLRAPLRTIRCYTEIINTNNAQNFDEDGKNLSRKIVQKAGEMGNIIESLLNLFRLGRKEPELKTISMKEMVRSICNSFASRQNAGNVEFSVGDLSDATGDEELLKHVWSILVDNAVKFSSKKEKTQVEIRSVKKENEIDYSIQDNGAGFNMKYSHKLFGMFQRMHSQEEFEGKGLGLAIAKRFIEMQGGKIWAESKPDEGSVFYFSLPKRAEIDLQK